jgi:hypothetical protein
LTGSKEVLQQQHRKGENMEFFIGGLVLCLIGSYYNDYISLDHNTDPGIRLIDIIDNDRRAK